MNPSEQNTDGAVVATTPLFASTWLALFNVLRKNYHKRRFEVSSNIDSTDTTEKNNQSKKSN